MNHFKKESDVEGRFGDLIEQFLFLIYKYQMIDKEIDYFKKAAKIGTREVSSRA